MTCVLGDPRSGKTCLALYAAIRNRAAFPGGIFGMVPKPRVPLSETKSIERIPREIPALLIVDACENGKESLGCDTLQQTLRRWPQLQVLLTSRSEIESPLVRHAVELVDYMFHGANRLSFLLPDLLELIRGIDTTGCVRANGEIITPSAPEYQEIVRGLSHANNELLLDIARDPGILHSLSPRRFEEVVAEILSRQGYEIRLTPATHDGGVDIYAAMKSSVGAFLYLVECKKFAPDRAVCRACSSTVRCSRARTCHGWPTCDNVILHIEGKGAPGEVVVPHQLERLPGYSAMDQRHRFQLLNRSRRHGAST